MGSAFLRRAAFGVAAFVLFAVFATGALADDPPPGGSGSSPTATISTDQTAYVPGDTVHVTGANWLPGESVHVHAAANSNPFTYDSDVVASADGSIDASFPLPSAYADTFAVALTGALQGSVSTSLSDAFAAASSPASPPTIVSDQNDYAPGSTVTLTGAGWTAGESVHIVVNDTVGQTWKYEGDVVAGSDGSFTTQVTLANYFVSDYDVTATSAAGETATTKFTDSQPQNPLVASPTSVSIAPGDTAVYGTVTVAMNGNSNDCTVTLSATGLPSGATAVFGNSPVTTHTTFTSSFSVQTTTSTTQGTFTVNVVASRAANCQGNGTQTSNSLSLTVGKTNQTITFTQPTTPQSYGSTFFANPTASSGLAVSLGSTGPCSVAAHSGGGFDVTMTGSSGNCVLTASQAGNTQFNPAPDVQRTIAAQQRPITVTADPKTKVYGNADPALTYQITSGSLVGSDTLSGSLTRAAGEPVAGSPYAIQQGSLAAGGNYNLTFVGANFAISKRPITVTADPKTKTYGASDPALTYQVTSGSLAFSDSFSGSLARASGDSVAGSPYAITQGTLSLGTNYDLTFVGANLTITAKSVTVTADDKSKVYGNADPSFTFQVSGLVDSDSLSGVTCDVGGAHLDVGQYDITCSGNTNTNYSPSYVGGKLTVTKRPVTVEADPQTKVYGADDPTLTYHVTSGTLAYSDTFAGSLSRAAGEDVGTYAITQGSLTLGSNYDLTFSPANLVITKRPIQVTADPKTKVYGNSDPGLTYQVTSGSLAFSDVFTGALTREVGKDVGTYAIKQGTLALTSNYDLSYVGANLIVTKRPIEVTADSKTKVYGNSDPALTYQVSWGSLAFSDAFSGALTRDAGEDVGSYAIKAGTLALTDNYDLSYVGANLVITKRPVEVTADPKTKVYGTADAALTYQVTSGSLAFSDAFSGALTRDAGEDVGTYAITQGTLALSDNYGLSFVGANLSITKRPITVTADGKSKTYGDSDPALTYEVTAGSLAFSDAFTGNLARDAGENVGSYPITQGTLALTDNYDLTYVGANLTITKATLAIDAGSQTKTYGDANPSATYSLSGFKFSDNAGNSNITGAANCSYTGIAIDVGVYPGEITCGPGTLLAPNYDFAGGLKGSLTITKRSITITADAKSKVYGDADPALTFQITSGSLAFSDDFTGALARAGGEDVGSYAITQGTVALSTNYDLHYVGANLTITRATLAVNAKDATKAYGDADPTAGYELAGFKFSDTATNSGITGATDCSFAHTSPNVGTYTDEITCLPGTLDAQNYKFAAGSKGTLTITKRPITVTADPKSKTYGDPDPVLTYQVTSGNLVGTDTFSGSLSRVAGETVANSPYTIQQGSLTAGGNYNLAYVSADLTIGKKTVTASFTADNKVYDGTTSATVHGTVVGKLVGDAVNLTGGTQAFQNKNVGTGKTVDISTYVLTGADAGNYSLTPGPWTATADITKRPITVTADAKSKVYGNPDPALTYSVTSGNLVSGDAFSGSLTRAPGETVAGSPYAVQQGTLTAGGNYDLTYVGANLTITKRPITVTADAKSKILGAVDPALTYQITSGTLVGTDAFTGSLTRAPGETVGTYAILQGTLALSSDYTLSFVSAPFNIYYGWSGFLQPINDTAHDINSNPDVSTFKAGSTVPVKFQTLNAAGQPVQAGAVAWLTPTKGNATTQPVDELTFSDPPSSGSSFSWDGQKYQYNWGTAKNQAGFYWKLVVKLDDGTTHSVYISLR